MKSVSIVVQHGKGRVHGSNELPGGAVVVSGRDVHFRPSGGGRGSQVTLQQDGTYTVKLSGSGKLTSTKT